MFLWDSWPLGSLTVSINYVLVGLLAVRFADCEY